jgi:16S rRNA (cytidine1402-2'-O)-methyltransferase
MLTRMTGRLLLCATPIGNLGDASGRLRSALDTADLVYAEDTRRAAKLLSALDVHTPVRSYFVGNEQQRAGELRRRLDAGETVAVISDAGMPSIADPGLSAVQVAEQAGAEVSVVPGPSAVTTALAASGLPAERFVFEGFLPRRGGERRRRIEALRQEQRTTVLFSGKSRVVADLTDLAAVLNGDRRIVVARELTKVFEELWKGTLDESVTYWASQQLRGEFTLVIAGAAQETHVSIDRTVARVADAIDAGESMADAVRRIASESGINRRQLYEAVLNDRQ